MAGRAQSRLNTRARSRDTVDVQSLIPHRLPENEAAVRHRVQRIDGSSRPVSELTTPPKRSQLHTRGLSEHLR
jgi:hypothetical protein